MDLTQWEEQIERYNQMLRQLSQETVRLQSPANERVSRKYPNGALYELPYHDRLINQPEQPQYGQTVMGNFPEQTAVSQKSAYKTIYEQTHQDLMQTFNVNNLTNNQSGRTAREQALISTDTANIQLQGISLQHVLNRASDTPANVYRQLLQQYGEQMGNQSDNASDNLQAGTNMYTDTRHMLEINQINRAALNNQEIRRQFETAQSALTGNRTAILSTSYAQPAQEVISRTVNAEAVRQRVSNSAQNERSQSLYNQNLFNQSFDHPEAQVYFNDGSHGYSVLQSVGQTPIAYRNVEQVASPAAQTLLSQTESTNIANMPVQAAFSGNRQQIRVPWHQAAQSSGQQSPIQQIFQQSAGSPSIAAERLENRQNVIMHSDRMTQLQRESVSGGALGNSWKMEPLSPTQETQQPGLSDMPVTIHINGNEFTTSSPVDPQELADMIGHRLVEEIHSSASGVYA